MLCWIDIKNETVLSAHVCPYFYTSTDELENVLRRIERKKERWQR